MFRNFRSVASNRAPEDEKKNEKKRKHPLHRFALCKRRETEKKKKGKEPYTSSLRYFGLDAHFAFVCIVYSRVMYVYAPFVKKKKKVRFSGS